MIENLLLFLVIWIINAVTLGVTSWLVPGVRIKSVKGALLGAAALGVVIWLVKPVLVFLSIPFLLLTLGLFYVVIITFCFWLGSKISSDFEVDGFLPALLGAIVLSAVNWLISFMAPGATWW